MCIHGFRYEMKPRHFISTTGKTNTTTEKACVFSYCVCCILSFYFSMNIRIQYLRVCDFICIKKSNACTFRSETIIHGVIPTQTQLNFGYSLKKKREDITSYSTCAKKNLHSTNKYNYVCTHVVLVGCIFVLWHVCTQSFETV